MWRLSTSLRKSVALQPGQRIQSPSGTPRLGRPGSMFVLFGGFMLRLRRTALDRPHRFSITTDQKNAVKLFLRQGKRAGIPPSLVPPASGGAGRGRPSARRVVETVSYSLG